MSGGVDSAVALLRAGPDAVGVTLRLWLDPHGPDTERACCSPSAVIAARETCHALGLPHVTLDLREEFRRAVVTPFVRGYARGETPNPCIRCNGGFRFAELLAFARARRRRAARDRPLRAHRRARRAAAARARAPTRAKDQSYMLARLDPRRLDAHLVPARRRRRRTRRAPRRRAAGLAAARRAESQEACFLAGDDYRAFLERQGLAPRPGAIVDEDGRDARRRTTASGGSRPASAAASASRRPSRSTRSRPTRARTPSSSGPRASLARTRVSARGRLYAPADRVDGEAPLPLAGGRRDGRADGVRVPAPARRAGLRRRARAGGRALRRRRRRRFRVGHVRRG